MEPERKKKKGRGRRKVHSTDTNFEEKPKPEKITKKRGNSSRNDLSQKRLSLHSSNFIPTKIPPYDNLIHLQNFSHQSDDNYFETITKRQKALKKIDDEIDDQYNNRNIVINFLEEIDKYISLENKKCVERINEIKEEEYGMNSLKSQIDILLKDLNIKESAKLSKKKLFENRDNAHYFAIKEIEKEIQISENNLTIQENKNKEMNNKLPELLENISKYEQEITQEKNIENELTLNKNALKEEYFKINTTAINDNKFCHDNFFALLTLFPYYKNVAFISTQNNTEINDPSNNLNNDENKMILDEQMLNDIENENIQKIKNLLKQKEEIENQNINYKILNDRRTLQLNPKEKYKFNKIFSIINNNYIADTWDIKKYSSFKLSTINSYFNEFNMTAISNNYFIIYFVPFLDKSSLKGELFSLFQQLKNNEYLDKNITIKISAITDSTYINLQNITQDSNIKTQIASIENSGIHTIHGFLYEFIKSNRLNKKNIFRLYNFDYNYPYAIDMMNNIAKYYAKKKRKKTGVYKKVIRNGNQQKGKKRQADKSVNNNNGTNNNVNNKNNNNLNKGNLRNNQQGIKKNNANKVVQFKKSVITTNTNNNRNTSLNNTNSNNNNLNKSFIVSNKKDNNVKRVFNNSSLDNQKNLKKSGSSQHSNKKDKKNQLGSKNNIKYVKFDDKPKSITPKKNNSANKELPENKKTKINSIVFNDLKTIKPEHTLIIHDINANFVNSNEFKNIAKACGILNNNEK